MDSNGDVGSGTRETKIVKYYNETNDYKLIKDMYDKAVQEKIIDTIEPHTTTLMYNSLLK